MSEIYSCDFSPQPPQMNIIWHKSPAEIHRAAWQPIAEAEGMSYEQFMSDTIGGGYLETGEEVTFSHEQEIEGIETQGCWGFVDHNSNTIHAWADPTADDALVIHMIGHEIGHATGNQHPDGLQEEFRAEQFGRVASQALKLLAGRPS